MLPFSVQWPLYTNVGPSWWITWWCPKQNLVVNTCWWDTKVPRQMGTFNLKGKFEICSCSSKIWTIPFSGSSSPHLQSFSQPYKKNDMKYGMFTVHIFAHRTVLVMVFIKICVTEVWISIRWRYSSHPWTYFFNQQAGKKFWHVFIAETQINSN